MLPFACDFAADTPDFPHGGTIKVISMVSYPETFCSYLWTL